MYNDNVYIERIMIEIGQELGTRFEFECYDIGHLYTLAHFAERGLVKPPFLIQGVFGILGGIGADPRNLAHGHDRRQPVRRRLSVLGLRGGRHQMPFCTRARCSAAMSASGWRTVSSSAAASWREQRRSGAQDPHDPRGPGPRDRHAGRGACRCWT
jgi:hypothetical protein